MKKYALIGERLGHSYSPFVHNEIYKDLNIDAEFTLLECKKEELGEVINLLRKGSYQGFNVTFPYKIEVMQYLDDISPEAKAVGSVNTVFYRDGRVIGYNTDVYGFYAELLYFKVPVKDKECYILGTGGASLAVHKALEDLGGRVHYVSRTKRDGVITYSELEDKKIDVLVNATPVGLYPNSDACPCKPEIAMKASYVLDVIFNPRITKILEYGGSVMNGLFMLVYQAIKSEEIFQHTKYEFDARDLLDRLEASLNE